MEKLLARMIAESILDGISKELHKGCDVDLSGLDLKGVWKNQEWGDTKPSDENVDAHIKDAIKAFSEELGLSEPSSEQNDEDYALISDDGMKLDINDDGSMSIVKRKDGKDMKLIELRVSEDVPEDKMQEVGTIIGCVVEHYKLLSLIQLASIIISESDTSGLIKMLFQSDVYKSMKKIQDISKIF